MRFKNLPLAALLPLSVLGVSSVHAAVKDYDVNCRLAVIQDGQLIHESRRQAYGFSVEIISDDEGVKEETNRNGKPFVAAAEGENYSVRLTNPLPVEVAVNLTVDGLNSISGKPSGISDGEKWILEPNSSVTIPGWQVNGASARRFFFTDKPKSYAKWRGDSLGKDLSANCGVIGAAFFWSQTDLNRYFDEHPSYRYSQNAWAHNNWFAKKSLCVPNVASNSLAAQGVPERDEEPLAAPVPEQQAGTGMGDSESHPTYQVNFDYDRGMYQAAQAVVIYYDFAKAEEPNPFPDMAYAPQQP
jgi:hypothetical protein